MEKFNEMGKPKRKFKKSIGQETSYKQGATVGAATGNTKLNSIRVSERTAGYIELLRKYEEFTDAIYDKIEKDFGDEMADSLFGENFAECLYGIRTCILNFMADSITDMVASTKKKAV